MAKVLFIAAIGYCLIADYGLREREWYSSEVEFSEWRGVPPVDYSTNAPVSTWYSGHPTKYFRLDNVTQFLAEPDTVTVGMDYYALYPSGLVVAPLFHSRMETDRIHKGGVVVSKFYHGKLIVQGR